MTLPVEIANISDVNNFSYYLNQTLLDSFVHLLTDFDDVTNSEVIYVNQGDYYALEFNYTFFDDGGIQRNASCLAPLQDDGIDAYINIDEATFFFSCDNTEFCGTCQVKGPSSSTETSIHDCLCNGNIVDYEQEPALCDKNTTVKVLPQGSTVHIWYLGHM